MPKSSETTVQPETNSEATEKQDAFTPATVDDRGWKWKAAALIALSIAFVLFSTLGYLFAARRLPVLRETDYTAAYQKWAKDGPTNYDMDISLEGATPGKIHIEVRHNEVTAMQRDGKTPKQKRTWKYWSVDGMFHTLDREFDILEDPAKEMNLPKGTTVSIYGEFDPKYGYPKAFQRLMSGTGPDVYWEVTRFEVK